MSRPVTLVLCTSATVIRPYEELIGAVAYQKVRDRIEPDKRPYHVDDPLNCVLEAARRTYPGELVSVQ